MRLVTIAAGEIDGIPAFWWEGPPGESEAGKSTAGLMFRVGMADETLSTRGITHLLEHLVLYPLRVDAARHFNGQTGMLTTTFLTSGSAHEVTEFFKAVCATLRDLPASRVQKEKQVLKAEAGGRDLSPTALLWRHRYGAEGYGLCSYPELGLDRAGLGDLESWAVRGFTRGNAALWIVGGEPPDGLRLDLPDGARMAVREMPGTIRRAPAYFNAKVAGPVFSGLVERSVAAQVYASVLADRVTGELRYQQALTYSPVTQYLVRDGRHAHIVAGADGTPESMSVLTAEFLRLVSRLREHPVEDSELRRVTERLSRHRDAPAPADVRAQVTRAAENTLLGRPIQDPEVWRQTLDGLTAGDVRRVAEEAFESGVFVLPPRQQPFIGGIPHVPWASEGAVPGRDVPAADAPFVATRLVIGEDGVSIGQDKEVRTVRFADCAAVLASPDGGRELIGRDGIAVSIEPTLWRLPPTAMTRIEEAVPEDRHVQMPYRPPEKVPRPGTPAWLRVAGRLADSLPLAIVVTLLAILGIPLIIGQFSEVAGLVAAFCLALLFLTILGMLRTVRVFLWRSAAKRMQGSEPLSDTGVTV